MTTTIQNLDDLQDRRIMMDRDVPPYGYAFVILVGLFMIFLLVWSTRTNRIYVSQNSGTVQASNKTYIMSSYSGTLTELYISEGSYVNEGDLVAHIKSTDLDMQQDNLESQLKIYQTQVDQYNKLLQCIQTTRTTSVRPVSRISPTTTSTRPTRARWSKRPLTLRLIRRPVTPTPRSRP